MVAKKKISIPIGNRIPVIQHLATDIVGLYFCVCEFKHPYNILILLHVL